MSTEPIITPLGRQERTTDKKEVMVYMPADLYAYLLKRIEETGLSRSAYLVLLIRRERFHVEP